MRKLDRLLITLIIVSVLSAYFVSAQPMGVEEISVGASQRYNDTTTPTAVFAQAGNVTELSINATAVTKSWQGYYGNVTGTIILADSSGNNFYNWNVSTPSGEVYASRVNNVQWTGISCANAGNVSAEETYLGQSATDPDSVSNTFAVTTHPAFNVGTTSISSCPSTQAFDSTGGPGTGFWQVLLADTSNNIVYTTIIDNVIANGFNNLPWHFQLLVGENGKVGNEAPTPYYFYVELV